MKVDKLHVRSRFKNLENVLVDFDKNNLMTVVVGQNGSGKSNVLEALVAIFRNLDLGEAPPFSYELVYRLGQEPKENEELDSWQEITIDADPNRGSLAKQYKVSVIDKVRLSGLLLKPLSLVLILYLTWHSIEHLLLNTTCFHRQMPRI